MKRIVASLSLLTLSVAISAYGYTHRRNIQPCCDQNPKAACCHKVPTAPCCDKTEPSQKH